MIREVSLSSKNTRAYVDAWIFIDRPDRADDNAEHLYRYAQKYHPEINSWFMLTRDSKDWYRLSQEGFRLIRYGELQSVSAVLKASFILSSHLDTDVYEPIDREKFGTTSAKRVFLQHGITMNDISKWINTKNLALVTACSPGELESFAGDESNYRLLRNQTKLTGFPRHDKLLELSSKIPLADRNTLLIVPTWRKSLSEQLAGASTNVERTTLLTESEFCRGWSSLLTSEEFLDFVKRNNLKPIFAVHDHLSQYSSLFDFDKIIRVATFSELSMQETLTSSKLVITDYSSLGVEAAIAGAVVLYYQFDSDSIYAGSHTFSKSWFSYVDHGVGPVVSTVSGALTELRSLSSDKWHIPPFYSKRLSLLVPQLDGGASERVINEVKLL